MASKKTAIVTGASQGIGAAVVRAFMDLRYNVVGNARSFSSGNFTLSPNLALVEGDIGLATTAEKIAQTAIEKLTGHLASPRPTSVSDLLRLQPKAHRVSGTGIGVQFLPEQGGLHRLQSRSRNQAGKGSRA